MKLNELGWNEHFEGHYSNVKADEFTPGRVAKEFRERYVVLSQKGELWAEVTGKFLHSCRSRSDFPVVGDWVALAVRPGEDQASIHAVLPRQTRISRKAVLSGGMPDSGGRTDEQVLAANINTAFLITGLDGNFSLRRIERYLAAAWDGGALPVIVLNKADLCGETEERISEVEAVAFGVPVHVVSALEGTGVEALKQYAGAGQTVVLLGSSGVGKSSLINRLLGEERFSTREVRAYDSKGRHTTTHREIVRLPSGGLLIDTPGLRELQLWDAEDGSRTAFQDIEQLVAECRFSDCQHESEPGCAIQTALKIGDLDSGRYQNYLKLQKEAQHLALKKDKGAARRAEREWDKRIRKHHEEIKRLRKKGLA